MKYRTPSEYRVMVRNMHAQELANLGDVFNASTTLKPGEIIIRDIINAEVERRIANWEMAQV